MTTELRVGVVGATGAVGQELLSLFEERAFPIGSLRLFASSRSAGRVLTYRGCSLAVEDPDVGGALSPFRDLDVAFFSAGAAVSRGGARAAAATGCLVVDNSSAFRHDEDVPLVVPEVNPQALRGNPRLIANPNCTTILACLVLGPLDRAFGLRRVVASSYQAASGAGARGLEELRAGTAAYLEGRPEEPHVFPAPLAFNVIPRVGTVLPGGDTEEEAKLQREGRKILGLPALEVAATCVRVPVARAHAVALTAWFARPMDPTEATAVVAAAPGVALSELPTPREASGRDDVLVGRIRSLPFDDHGLQLFVVGDQIRKGAALNAVQIAERVMLS